jgi:hypothetical protein
MFTLKIYWHKKICDFFIAAQIKSDSLLVLIWTIFIIKQDWLKQFLMNVHGG